MKFSKRLALVAAIIFVCVGCDQVSKSIVVQTLAHQSEAVTYLNGVIRLQYAENPGAFLGFGDAIPESLRFWIFTVAVSVILLFGLIALLRARRLSVPVIIAAASIVGGGIGNVIDRLFNEGHVVDFLNVGIGSLRTGIFNVADMAITFGALALLILTIFQRPETES